MIRLVFLGRLADVAGATSRVIASERPLAIAEIFDLLERPLAQALRDARIRFALNGVLAADADILVVPGDELAFLPPVSGG